MHTNNRTRLGTFYTVHSVGMRTSCGTVAFVYTWLVYSRSPPFSEGMTDVCSSRHSFRRLLTRTFIARPRLTRSFFFFSLIFFSLSLLFLAIRRSRNDIGRNLNPALLERPRRVHHGRKDSPNATARALSHAVIHPTLAHKILGFI